MLWFCLPDLRLTTLVLIVSHVSCEKNLNDSGVKFVSACILLPTQAEANSATMNFCILNFCSSILLLQL